MDLNELLKQLDELIDTSMSKEKIDSIQKIKAGVQEVHEHADKQEKELYEIKNDYIKLIRSGSGYNPKSNESDNESKEMTLEDLIQNKINERKGGN